MDIELTLKKLKFSKNIEEIISVGMSKHAKEMIGFENKSDYMVLGYYDNDFLVGAAVYRKYWGVLVIKYLYVEKEYRKQNIGTSLLNKLFKIAKEDLNLKYVYLSTLSFQALNFYKKLGFKIEYIRDKFEHGIKEYYLTKKLQFKEDQHQEKS